MADNKDNKNQPANVLTSTVTFVAVVDGQEHYVRTGDRLHASHAVAKAHPTNFRPVSDTD